MEHQDAAICKLLDEMRLVEVRQSERISGRCDSVERRWDERCEEPCDESSIFDEGPSSTRSPISITASSIWIQTLPVTGLICP
jgi:hypothetical protein